MQQKIRKIIAMLLAVAVLITLLPTIGMSAAKKPKLSKGKATIYVGKTIKLKVKNYQGKVKWKTSNKKVATVNKKGKVTGKKNGKAIITAMFKGGKLKCSIKVKNKKVEKKTTVPKETESKNISQEMTTEHIAQEDIINVGENKFVKLKSDEAFEDSTVATVYFTPMESAEYEIATTPKIEDGLIRIYYENKQIAYVECEDGQIGYLESEKTYKILIEVFGQSGIELGGLNIQIKKSEKDNDGEVETYEDDENEGFPYSFCIDGDYKFTGEGSGQIYLSQTGYYEGFKFIPEETGYYSFYSESQLDTFGYLLEGEFPNEKIVDSNDDYIGSDFGISYYCEAGKTYIILASILSEGTTNEIIIHIKKGELY